MNIEEIRSREQAATPGPWKRSFFVDKYPRMSEPEKQDCRRVEQLTIRGPGQIGTPQCNAVCRFSAAQDNDIEFIAHAREDIPYLLSEVERLNAQHHNDNCRLFRQRKIKEELDCELEALEIKTQRLTAELEQKTRELERYRKSEDWPQWKIDAYDTLFTIPAASKEKLAQKAELSAEGVSE